MVAEIQKASSKTKIARNDLKNTHVREKNILRFLIISSLTGQSSAVAEGYKDKINKNQKIPNFPLDSLKKLAREASLKLSSVGPG